MRAALIQWALPVFAAAIPLVPGLDVAAETLADALAAAYTSNPTLVAERARLRATDEGVPQALSGYRPTLEANGTLGKSVQDSDLAFGGVGGGSETL
ncbi:MAG: hypothetical protein FJX56_10515, partial [Alphaproteobacteria bacterium]|nr:hypothetical protein [Alphaproteobacteria bacterium]